MTTLRTAPAKIALVTAMMVFELFIATVNTQAQPGPINRSNKTSMIAVKNPRKACQILSRKRKVHHQLFVSHVKYTPQAETDAPRAYRTH